MASRARLSIGLLLGAGLISCSGDDGPNVPAPGPFGAGASSVGGVSSGGSDAGAENRTTGGAQSGGVTGSAGAAMGGTNQAGASEGGTSEGGASAFGGSVGASSGSAGRGDTGGSGGAGPCTENEVRVEPVPASVVLLVDRSLSMLEDFGGDTRWNVLRDVLTSSLVEPLAADVRFGLTLFSAEMDVPECPLLFTVPVALDNGETISAALFAAEPLGTTPTAESLNVVTTELYELSEPGPKIIVLATDGEPNICNEPSPGPSEAAREGALQAVENAFLSGITTLVLSVGQDIGEDLLHGLANVGQGFPAGEATERFFRATDGAELGAALTQIAASFGSCVLELNGTLDPSLAGTGLVTLDGAPLVYDDPNGWRMYGDSAIELLGAACQSLPSATSFDVDFPCGVFTPGE